MKPKCYNCKHAGKPFKAFNLTHVHCGNIEKYPLDTEVSAWETLKEWWDKCSSHEPKEEVKE